MVKNDSLITYEKAFEGQAAGKKCSPATFLERKIMSTKTSFKRIALVAASALAIGGFSAVSANAAPAADGDITVTVGTNTGTATAAAVSTVAGVGNYIGFDLETPGHPIVFNLVVTGGTVSGNVANTDITSGNGTSNLIISSTAAKQSLTVPTPTNGTIKVSVYGYTAGVRSSTATSTLTITVGDAPKLVSGYVTSQITSGTASTAGAVALTQTGNRYTGADAEVSAPSTANGAAGAEVAVIGVALASAFDTPYSAYIGASISGAGTISITEDAAVQATAATPGTASRGTSLSSAAKNQFYRISVFADGRAGVGTITITDGTNTLVTKTVTFFGDATKATATQNLNVAKAGAVLGAKFAGVNYSVKLTGDTVDGTAAQNGTAAYTVALVDKNGNAATPVAAPIIKSSASTIIVNEGCTAVTAKVGIYQCSVSGAGGATSGQTATITFSIPATATEVPDETTGLYSIKAAALTFAIGGSVQKVVLSTDSDSYTPLAPVKLIAKATDSKGNAAYDQDFDNSTTPLIASLKTSAAFAGTKDFVSPAAIINGVGTFGTLYAPSIEGDVTVTGLDNVSIANEAVSTTFAVANGAVTNGTSLALDAANAATDAANNAYDEAQNATQAASDALAAIYFFSFATAAVSFLTLAIRDLT